MNNFTFNNDFNNKKPKEETERERMTRIAKVLYPTMKDKDEEKEYLSSFETKSSKKQENVDKPKRIEDILYPTMRDKNNKKEEQTKENKNSPLSLNSLISDSELYKLIFDKGDYKKIKGDKIGTTIPLETKENIIEKVIGKDYNGTLNNLAKVVVGSDTAGQLDLAHGDKMNARNYIKDVIHLDNYNDPKIRSDREYLKDKVSGQFKDYNFDIGKIKGYFFKSDSEPVQRIIENKDFQSAIKKNKDKILKTGEFSFQFPKHGLLGIGKDNNFHYSINKADFKHGYQDKEGNLHIKMYDTYDFNKDDNFLIKAGREQMKKGNLHPYFTIHDIIVPKKVLDKIWK